MSPEDDFFRDEPQRPICDNCGKFCLCLGFCSGPGTCRSCLPYTRHLPHCHIGWRCALDDCPCDSHIFDPYDEDDEEEYLDDLLAAAPDYDNRSAVKGSFPFLSLPKEIRDEIYYFTIYRYGNRRRNPYFHGTIHTALTQTCRQINQEARHLPLSINELTFHNLLHALDFFAFQIPASVRDFVTSVNLQIYIDKANFAQWNALIPQLKKMSIKHLTLTIDDDWHRHDRADVLRFACGSVRFKPFKSLRSIRLRTSSGRITEQGRKKIENIMKMKFIDGYKASKMKGVKRSAAYRGDKSTVPVLKRHKSQAKLKLTKNEGQQTTDTQLTFEVDKSTMFRYSQLEQYAMSVDISLVAIRLERAREAAQNQDDLAFARLAQDILNTLEERFQKIFTTRKSLSLPGFNNQRDAGAKQNATASKTEDPWDAA